MLLLHAAHQAHAEGDHRGLVNAVRAVAELDGLYPKEEPTAGTVPVVVHVSLQLPQRVTPPSFLTVNAERPVLLPVSGGRNQPQAEVTPSLSSEPDQVDVHLDVDPLS
jgi:hypothetical protein